jgi:glycosyltransferase involved in cell wall biosynthesis
MKWLFVGPTLLAGIGQVTRQYSELIKSLGHEADYITFGDSVLNKKYDVGFAFVLPIEQHLNIVDTMLEHCTKKVYMTICETETVHPVYEILVTRYKTLWTPSQFCLDVFKRQFPRGDWRLLHLWAPDPVIRLPVVDDSPYTFYTIGNMIDPRKNIKMLIEAFVRLQLPNARLLLKATCKQDVPWRIPGVVVINGLLSDDELERQIHSQGHCYINCSHSEGVGMGAVEAALRDKPVIITDFGGLKEYVPDTPFIVKCTPKAIEQDDFLFQKGMIWGQPSIDDLMSHMRTCYESRIVHWTHTGTKNLIHGIGETLMKEPVSQNHQS